MGPEMNDENGKEMDQLSMEQLMERSMQTLREGEVVTGTVVAVGSDEVLVDIGFKCEGVVPTSEFTDTESGEPGVKVNDEIEVFVERLDETEGRVRLSRDRAEKLKVWTVIEDHYKAGDPVHGRVIERVKGGLSVDIGIRAFLPGSLVDLRPNRRLEDYIGDEIEARVISFDRRRSNVVLSRKAILEEEQAEAKEETMAVLEEGKLVSGVIKNITDYGVFVDLGGIDGLLHITDISWGRVGHPSEYFEVGDEVEVVVLRFDRDRERVSLGYKQRFEDPWVLVPEKYPVGKRVEGKVVSLVDYGAFVALEEGVEGLIHVSEMSWTKKIKNPRSVLDVDQEVEVVVSEVDPEKRRLSLSLRATEPNPWHKVAEDYSVGNTIGGVVRNLTDFGAFVEIVPGVDGLVHISDMSWTRRINHPSEVVQKGDEVNAVITSIDVVNQRISLSMKELLPNEWEEYANSHGVGDVVVGNVTNITDFGVFVELAPGVEGLCHISEIERDPGLALLDMFVSGQPVRCRILRVDWNENRIGLSMQGVTQDEVEEEIETKAESGVAAGADTAMAAALRAGGLVPEEVDDSSEEEAADVAADAPESPADEGEPSDDAGDEAAAAPGDDLDATPAVAEQDVTEDQAAPETAVEAAEPASDEDEPRDAEAATAPADEPETTPDADAGETDADGDAESASEDDSVETAAADESPEDADQAATDATDAESDDTTKTD
jgi:small subunit ribosomal protein S1